MISRPGTDRPADVVSIDGADDGTVPHDGRGPTVDADDALDDEANELRWADAATRMVEADGFYSFLSILAGLALFEVGARILSVSYFPPVTAVMGRLYRLTVDGEIVSDVINSIQNLALGFSIAAVIGVFVGLLMGRFQAIEKMLDPYVIAFMTAPAVVFAPIYFSIFGLQRWSIILLIVQYSVFIIIVNTVTAVQAVDRELVEMSTVFGSNERQRLLKVVLPGALPLVMAGFRLAMGRSVKGMINGELLIAVVGLGATSQNFARARDAEGVFAILLVVIVVALGAVKLVEAVDRRVNGWLPNAQR